MFSERLKDRRVSLGVTEGVFCVDSKSSRSSSRCSRGVFCLFVCVQGVCIFSGLPECNFEYCFV